jgi:GH15 family glucan-1,4-alpha-glucosidase
LSVPDLTVLPPPRRDDGYAPIRDYAAIGDGRTVALVARDGSIDWLPFPSIDSPTVFGSLLDARRGGSFTLAPDLPYTVGRRYLPGTNILETTFVTETGAASVTDAMTVPAGGLFPFRELIREVKGLRGRVRLTWRVEPRFGYGAGRSWVGLRQGIPVAEAGGDAVAIRVFEAGDPEVEAGSVSGRFEIDEGGSALIALCFAHQEPLVFPSRSEIEDRSAETVAAWHRWLACGTYRGRWQEAVERSGLVLKLLFFAPSGAVAAAPTTSLPEEIGGQRNWDYRLSWVRDSAFTLDALLRVGCAEEAEAFFWWLMQASQLTHPRLQVLYRMDGGAETPERTLDLTGYRDSRPVRVGNAAAGQLQLEIYGSLFETAWLLSEAGHRIDRDVAKRLAATADLVCEIWLLPDSGIWEVRSEPAQFTQSKMMCWVALDRAVKLAELGRIPDLHVDRWRGAASAIREFIEGHCWSDRLGTYIRAAGKEELDASILTGALFGYGDVTRGRLANTVEAIRLGLGHGPFLYRYLGEDGLPGEEGAFLTCSFWLVEALVHAGRKAEAAELMDQLLSHANDVGLFAEEIRPEDGDFLGNFPQALTHLALIGAAVAFEESAG